VPIVRGSAIGRGGHQGQEANDGAGKGAEIKDDPPELPNPETGEGIHQRRSERLPPVSEPTGWTIVQGADPMCLQTISEAGRNPGEIWGPFHATHLCQPCVRKNKGSASVQSAPGAFERSDKHTDDRKREAVQGIYK